MIGEKSDSWQQRYRQKIILAHYALSKIKNGSCVFLGTGAGEPQHLIQTLMEKVPSITY